MVCKKCGCKTLIENGDWLECTYCGAKYFNTEIEDKSATQKIEEIEEAEKAETEKKKKEKNGKKKSKLKDVFDFLLPIIIALIIALLLRSFVFANAVVPTGSMISTIDINDRIIANRLAYISDDPERYDVIIFQFPDDEDTAYVKRIIGLPGETVEVVNGVTYITDTEGNTYQTDQSFVTEGTPTGNYGPYYIPEMGEVITVDESGTCYAENGMEVGDSSTFLELYCETDENGNYVVAENCYFCMGDNRNNSADSRYWTNKYVAQSKIIGKVMFKYYPSIEKIE